MLGVVVGQGSNVTNSRAHAPPTRRSLQHRYSIAQTDSSTIKSEGGLVTGAKEGGDPRTVT